MNFDKIIMNPPYCGNLHLKILREAMKLGKEVVNLSPIRWLQDPLAEYKMNSDFKKFENIRKQIESVDEIKAEDAQKYFGALTGDLGIYSIKSNPKKVFDTKTLVKCPEWAVQKIALKKTKHLSDFKLKEPKGKHFIRMTTAYNTSGGKVVDKLISPSFESVYNNNNKKLSTLFFSFATKEEAFNFWTSMNLKLNRYIKVWLNPTYMTPFNLLPYLGDYTHPWTDEMLYDYFDLTKEERETIENEF